MNNLHIPTQEAKYTQSDIEYYLNEYGDYLKNNEYISPKEWLSNNIENYTPKTKAISIDDVIEALQEEIFEDSITDEHIDFLEERFGNHSYFHINGYYRDDKEEFTGELVYSYDSNRSREMGDDDSIFYYGLNELDIQKAIKEGEKSNLEFVITSYEKVEIVKE